MTAAVEPVAGDAGWWDSQAGTIEEARFAVWSVGPDDWERLTQECVDFIAARLPSEPRRLLDVGCGVGRLTLPLAARYGWAEVIGVDVSARMLALAAEEAARAGVCNAVFVGGDGVTVPEGPWSGAWTVVVFQHNPRDVCARLVASVADRLESGGVFVFQTVGDVDFEDECHVPDAVLAGWATSAGLEVESVAHGVVFPDWTWVTAVKR